MNENINLCEILKGHEGETFYSPCFGNCRLDDVNNLIYFTSLDTEVTFSLRKDGKYSSKQGELMLFPSKDYRDWDKWVEERNKVPKTWSELIKSNTTLECKINVINKQEQHVFVNASPVVKSALALLKIHKLIEVGYGGNVTNEEWETFVPYYIWYNTDNERFMLNSSTLAKHHIAFHTKEQAEEFLKYPENVQLLKDYFMI